MHLNDFLIKITNGSDYIATTFNKNTIEALYIICIYKAHSCSLPTFLNPLETLIQTSPEQYPTIILGDFNVDVLENNNHIYIYIYII